MLCLYTIKRNRKEEQQRLEQERAKTKEQLTNVLKSFDYINKRNIYLKHFYLITWIFHKAYKIKIMYSFSCSDSEHQGQQANYLCGDQQCIDKNPICTLCAFTSHKQHQVLPIKIVINNMKLDYQSSQSNLILFAKIDVLKERIFQISQQIADLQLKKSIQSSITHYFCILLQKIKVDKSFFLSQGKDFSKQQAYKQIIKYQKKCLTESLEEDKSTQQPHHTRLLKKIIQDLQQIANQFQQTVKEGEFDQSATELFVIQSFSKKFRFSSKLKHPKIQINEDNIVKMPDQYVNYNYFVLCEPKLSMNKPQSITFHMQNLSSYVTIGICNLDKLATNYEFNTGDSSHGSYQISFDGYSWGDTGNINSQYTGWYYNQGDKVTLEFNPKTKKLKFSKSQNQQEYEMGIELEKKDKLYFCVTLNSSPQEIHIINT